MHEHLRKQETFGAGPSPEPEQGFGEAIKEALKSYDLNNYDIPPSGAYFPVSRILNKSSLENRTAVIYPGPTRTVILLDKDQRPDDLVSLENCKKESI